MLHAASSKRLNHPHVNALIDPSGGILPVSKIAMGPFLVTGRVSGRP